MNIFWIFVGGVILWVVAVVLKGVIEIGGVVDSSSFKIKKK
jgi:hypothetical protein